VPELFREGSVLENHAGSRLLYISTEALPLRFLLYAPSPCVRKYEMASHLVTVGTLVRWDHDPAAGVSTRERTEVSRL
jgi:hypothetical protein